MATLYADFETRSKVDLKEHGLSRYVSDPSTLPLMFVWGNRSWQRQWILDLEALRAGELPGCPSDLREVIDDPRNEFHAHNAAFEIAIWSEICFKRWGWPEIPLNRWYCTAAKGSAANQPRALDMLVKRLGVDEKYHKDKRGKDLIGLLSIPQKCSKTYQRIKKGPDGKSLKDPDDPKGKRVLREFHPGSSQYLAERGVDLFEGECTGALYYFNEDPVLMAEFAAYNVQDIVAEAAADVRLPELTPMERQVWLLDQRINRRGIPVDLDLCRGALSVYEQEVDQANLAIRDLTEGKAIRCTMRAGIVEWLNERVNFGSTLDNETVTGFLEAYEDPSTWASAGCYGHPESIMPDVLKVLELRHIAGGTAVAKYKAALNYADEDGRCRNQLLYYGAATGRWTGKGIQPHNFKRSATPHETFIDALKTGDHGLVKLICEMEGWTVFELLKKSLRGIICAPPGKKLVVSDFAGIESRVLHWLVGNEKKLDLFRRREDTYLHSAMDIYGLTFEQIAEWSEKERKFVPRKEHKDKRQIGKSCELGLGYGMGSTTFQANAAKAKSFLTAEFSTEVVTKWREANPQVPEFWRRIERVCRLALQNKGQVYSGSGLRVFYDPFRYLNIVLPSGRTLYYFDPVIQTDPAKDSDRYGSIFYRDGGKTGSWETDGRINTYSGKLTENIVQAIARDLLVHSLTIIDNAGLNIIFHVHDEAVVEVDENDTTAKAIVHEAMRTLPPWAAGLPLEAETHETRRYTK